MWCHKCVGLTICSLREAYFDVQFLSGGRLSFKQPSVTTYSKANWAAGADESALCKFKSLPTISEVPDYSTILVNTSSSSSACIISAVTDMSALMSTLFFPFASHHVLHIKKISLVFLFKYSTTIRDKNF